MNESRPVNTNGNIFPLRGISTLIHMPLHCFYYCMQQIFECFFCPFFGVSIEVIVPENSLSLAAIRWPSSWFPFRIAIQFEANGDFQISVRRKTKNEWNESNEWTRVSASATTTHRERIEIFNGINTMINNACFCMSRALSHTYYIIHRAQTSSD